MDDKRVNEDKTFFFREFEMRARARMCVFFRHTTRKVYSSRAWFIFDSSPPPPSFCVRFPTYIPTYLSIFSLFISLAFGLYFVGRTEYSITAERVYEWKEILREMLPEPVAVLSLSPSSSNNRRIRSMYTGALCWLWVTNEVNEMNGKIHAREYHRTLIFFFF